MRPKGMMSLAVTFVLGVCVLGGVALTALEASAGRNYVSTVQERCVFEVPAATYAETREWVKRIRETGAIVTVVASPRLVLARATEAQRRAAVSGGVIDHLALGGDLAASVLERPTTAERSVFRLAGRVDQIGSPTASRWDAMGDAEWLDLMKEYAPVEESAAEPGSPGAPATPSGVSEAMSYDGYTDFMTGDIAVGVFPFESDGTIDSNWYDWTSEEVDTLVDNITDVLDAMAVRANEYAQNVTWTLMLFQPTDSRMQIPWQNHIHYPHNNSHFTVDTVHVWIYDKFGFVDFDTCNVLTSQCGNYSGLPETMNAFLADSSGADAGMHHFVGHTTTLCNDLDDSTTSGWDATASFGRYVSYPFHRTVPDGDTCYVAWDKFSNGFWRAIISHENIHGFGKWGEDYGSSRPTVHGDFTNSADGKIGRLMNYNKYGYGFPDFEFADCVMRSGNTEYPDICLACARQVGFWGHDFGDAHSPYASLKADGGAYHMIAGFEWLGVKTGPSGLGEVTFENDADSGITGYIDRDGRSNLDVIDGDRGDNGVFFDGQLTENVEDTFVVIMSNHGVGSVRYFSDDTAKIYLNAWFDWNGDGDWDDTGEQVIDSYSWVPADSSVLSDTVAFTFTPPTGFADTLWARFRLDYGEDCGTYERLYSDTTLNGPYGAAVYGEVEDYFFADGWFWVRGDLNYDHVINVQDLTLLNAYVFQSGAPPVPMAVGNTYCADPVNVLDVVVLSNYIYQSGAEPCPR